jgi:redox-sensing transcriptional repressor
MPKSENIPTPAVRRLSLYLRELEAFQEKDRRTVSSRQLGEALSLSDAQVRKDLAYFGQFGHPGVGYRVPELIQRVRGILGTDKISNVLLVGVGNIGRALLAFRGFENRGFQVVAAFDNDYEKVGLSIPGPRTIHVLHLHDMARVCRTQAIRVGILTVPAVAAQAVADEMVRAGIRGILNFAPVRLHLPPAVAVSSVDLAVHLEQLSFQLNGPKDA